MLTLPQSWQHDARLHSGASSDKILYTVFNDYNGDFTTHNPSSGITLILDLPSNGTKSLQPYANVRDPAQNISALAEGSYQLIDNETALLGYGVFPIIKEFDLKPGNGSTVKYTAQFAYNNYTASSYRSFKSDWHATPCTSIDVLIATSANATASSSASTPGSGKTGYVSWNGATDVTTYAIFAQANGSGDYADTGYYFDRKGFETSFEVPTELKSIQIVAYAGSSESGRSSAVAV